MSQTPSTCERMSYANIIVQPRCGVQGGVFKFSIITNYPMASNPTIEFLDSDGRVTYSSELQKSALYYELTKTIQKGGLRAFRIKSPDGVILGYDTFIATDLHDYLQSLSGFPSVDADSVCQECYLDKVKLLAREQDEISIYDTTFLERGKKGDRTVADVPVGKTKNYVNVPLASGELLPIEVHSNGGAIKNSNSDDGEWCTDLIRRYYQSLGVPNPETTGDGGTCAINAQAKGPFLVGDQYYQFRNINAADGGDPPKVGAIISFTGCGVKYEDGTTSGHVGMVKSVEEQADGSLRVAVVEQNNASGGKDVIENYYTIKKDENGKWLEDEGQFRIKGWANLETFDPACS